ncbi:MAG: TlpA disulfide reductase family protein [Cryomorphaceae bacterium]
MNYFKKQWEKFKAKSLWGKITDVLFLLLILAFLTKDGRILLQRGMLMSGLFSSLEANAEVPIATDTWQWSVRDADGKRYLLSDFKGEPIFLNFWATWCPPCNAEMPYMLEMIEAMGDELVFILATAESAEVVDAFLEKKGWDAPVYFIDAQPVNELQYTSLPTTFVISADGTVIHRSQGMRKWTAEGLREMLGDSN